MQSFIKTNNIERVPLFIVESVEFILLEFERQFQFIHDHQSKFKLLMDPFNFYENDLIKIFKTDEITIAELQFSGMISSMSQMALSKFK